MVDGLGGSGSSRSVIHRSPGDGTDLSLGPQAELERPATAACLTSGRPFPERGLARLMLGGAAPFLPRA